MDSWITLVLSGWLVAALIMFGLWLLYLYKGDPAVVDIGWGGSIGCAALSMFYLSPEGGIRQWLVLIAVLCWSLRIVVLLIRRMIKGQKDRRYVELSEHWKTRLPWKYFIFFQAQALTVAVLLISVSFIYLASNSSWTWLDTAGITLFVFSFSGEVLADWQMAHFRDNPKNRKKVCDVGLWRYSRHPNYFCEWMIWMSYALIAMNHPMGWIGWVSPILILTSILKVTGIPPTEERLLASKGKAYREYQRTTSVFIPLPPKKNRS